MIHFITVHFGSDHWVNIQLDQIARHTKAPYETWGCLNEIGPDAFTRFDHAWDLDGDHADKLNELARRVAENADPDDLLVFIDGDAFPIEDWLVRVEPLLETFPLVAVSRVENMGDGQPHPCFAVTRVGFWQQIGGDWTIGKAPYVEWPTTFGRMRTDVGALLMAKLDELNIDWYRLLRSNVRNLHPLMFGVYADIVYHHGAGFRRPYTALDAYETGWSRWRRSPLRPLGKWRLNRRIAQNRDSSERVMREIESDIGYIQRFFLNEPVSIDRR